MEEFKWDSISFADVSVFYGLPPSAEFFFLFFSAIYLWELPLIFYTWYTDQNRISKPLWVLGRKPPMMHRMRIQANPVILLMVKQPKQQPHLPHLQICRLRTNLIHPHLRIHPSMHYLHPHYHIRLLRRIHPF